MSADLARTLAAAAIAAVDPRTLLRKALEHWPLPQSPFVVAAGKASVAMLDAFRESVSVDRVVLSKGGHPLPDAASVHAAEGALTLAGEARRAKRELVVLLSGGASAMLAAPIEGVTLARKAEITKRLLTSGATIHELNAVRRHLSRIKGGRLALDLSCTTFALSDVTDDGPATIGSGPTVGDPTTIEDALRVLERHGLAGEMGDAIAAMRAAGETPKPGDAALARSRFVLVGGRRAAMDGAAAAALDAGFATIVFDEPITGEASRAGAAFVARAKAAAHRIGGGPVAVIASGETTVHVRGEGTGGRNHEFALGAALELEGAGIAMHVLACGTDGIDGNSPAAGAIADATTVDRARKAGLDPLAVLAANDTHALFSALGDAIATGPTGTNVGDVYVAVVR